MYKNVIKVYGFFLKNYRKLAVFLWTSLNFYGIVYATKKQKGESPKEKNIMLKTLPRSEVNQRIVEELRNGVSATELVIKYNSSLANISQLKQRYVDIPTELPTNIKKIGALQEFKYGDLSLSEISYKYGLSHSALALLKSHYKNSPAWDLIPPPNEKQTYSYPIKGTTAGQDPVIERVWQIEGHCTGCGNKGAMRISIHGNNCGTGISLCKNCLLLIAQEVIAPMQKWDVPNA